MVTRSIVNCVLTPELGSSQRNETMWKLQSHNAAVEPLEEQTHPWILLDENLGQLLGFLEEKRGVGCDLLQFLDGEPGRESPLPNLSHPYRRLW